MHFLNLLLQLMAEFPRIFKGEEPRSHSHVFEGWYPMLFDLCKKIEACLSDSELEQFRVLQIKEKFGFLRFYYYCDALSRSKVGHLIHAAYEQSRITCFMCGSIIPLTENDPNGPICTPCAKNLRASLAS